MRSTPPPSSPRIVVLGMGGTISARAASPHEDIAYRAGAVAVSALVDGLAPEGVAVESEQIAQIDSKDLGVEHWRALVAALLRHLGRDDVGGVVVTHGTDTLEETAYLLQRLLAPVKPVVITGAMRPASSLQADGPQNLRDALVVAASPEARGVLVSFAGTVHAGDAVRKAHPYRLDPFTSGDAGPIARIEAGVVRWLRPPPSAHPLAAQAMQSAPWPWVEIVTGAAAADARAVEALVTAGVRGIVVAGVGNGNVHAALEAALQRARERGVALLRATRCLDGRIVEAAGDATASTWPSAGALTPVQARVELALRLLAGTALDRAGPPARRLRRR